MDAISNLLSMILSFLLRLLELIVGFFIQMLSLFLEFARSVVGSIS